MQWVSAFRYSGRADGMTSTSCISVYNQRFNALLWGQKRSSRPRSPTSALPPESGLAASPPLCPARNPPQSVAACLFRAAPAHPLSHGHRVTRDHLRRIDPGSGRAGDRSTQRIRPARLRGVEQAHARLSGSGPAIARARRRDQRRVPLSRSEMPWLQHASDRCPRHRAATEDDAGP